MPFIHTRVNVEIPSEKQRAIKAKLGKAIELLPGKSESWLMLELEDECNLYFKGDGSHPIAFVEVKIFGSADAAAYSRLTVSITDILQEELGIEPSRIYVKYEETAHWGWNGSNF